MALDPGSDDVMVLPGRLMARVAHGGRDVLPAGATIAVGEPAAPPAAFFSEALAGAACQTPGVAQAWLVQLYEERLGPRLVGGVQLADGADAAQVMPQLTRAVTATLPAEQPLDLLQLTGTLSETALANLAPLLPTPN